MAENFNATMNEIILLILSEEDASSLLKSADEAKAALDSFIEMVNSVKTQRAMIEKEKENDNGNE